MSRKYTKIEQYKNQILSMKKEGKTQREIAEKFGLEKEHHGGYTGSCRFLLRFGLCVRGAFFARRRKQIRRAKKQAPPLFVQNFQTDQPVLVLLHKIKNISFF